MEYQKFQQYDFSGYPSLSLCFVNPFLEDKLVAHGTNTSSYIKYLQGSLQDESMNNIRYDQVTISLEDYLDYNINASRLAFTDLKIRPITSLNIYISLRADIMKCFTIDVPFRKNKPIFSFALNIRNSIFSNNTRPMNRPDKLEGFYISLHYPRQLLLASNPWHMRWKYRSIDNQEYGMLFEIVSLTVVRKRRISGGPCIDEGENYDQTIIDSVIKKLGCRPIFWETEMNIGACSNATHNSLTDNSGIMKHIWAADVPPCKYIEQLISTYQEEDDKDYLSGWY